MLSFLLSLKINNKKKKHSERKEACSWRISAWRPKIIRRVRTLESEAAKIQGKSKTEKCLSRQKADGDFGESSWSRRPGVGVWSDYEVKS